MSRIGSVGLLCGILIAPLLVRAADQGTDKTVSGWVLDSACAFTKGLTKPISRDCALACAKNGSQLVILQNDGTIYWPIADTMPAAGQNSRLTPFAGKRVHGFGESLHARRFERARHCHY